jgi:hypothetical protein
MITRRKVTNLIKSFTNTGGGYAEPGSIFASRDSCCQEDCHCTTNYGCRCEHDCSCPDRSLVEGELHELVLSNEFLAKLQGSAAADWERYDSDTPQAVAVPDRELYRVGERADSRDTLIGDTPLNDRVYKADGPPRPGLIPQSGDWNNPDRWIRPEAEEAEEPDLATWIKNLRTMSVIDVRDTVGDLAKTEAEGGKPAYVKAMRDVAVSEYLVRRSQQFDELIAGQPAYELDEAERVTNAGIAAAERTIASANTPRVVGLATLDRMDGKNRLDAIAAVRRRLTAAEDATVAAAVKARFTPQVSDALRLNKIWEEELGYSPRDATSEQRGAVKMKLIKDVAARLTTMAKSNPELAEALANPAHNLMRPFTEGQPTADRVTDKLISVWMESSSDSYPRAIALQLAAQKEFSELTTGSSTDHFEGDKSAWRVAERDLADNEVLFRSFHRAQYDNTQAWLGKNNVKSVTLYRGSLLSASKVKEMIPGTASTAMADVQTQPVSSFSYDPQVAYDFSTGHVDDSLDHTPTVSVSQVPANRIISTALTGYGCLTEGEFTVLGGVDHGLLVQSDSFGTDALEGLLNTIEQAQHAQVDKAGPPRPGLIPQSGDWEHPGHWIRPPEAGAPVEPEVPEEYVGRGRAAIITDARRAGFTPDPAEAVALERAWHKDLGYRPMHAKWDEQVDVKVSIAAAVSSELKALMSTDPALTLAVNNYHTPTGKSLDVDNTVRYLVGVWADSSGDHHDIALALQQSALREFPELTDGAATDHWDLDPTLRGVVRRELAESGAVYRAFHRAQYNNTQRWFKKHGITHVTLYRGMAIPKETAETALKGGTSAITDLATQPVSSYSYELETALEFATDTSRSSGLTPTLSVSRFPVERVLSTALTGFGCLTEGEVTVLGGIDKGLLVQTEDPDRGHGEDPGLDPEQIEKLITKLGPRKFEKSVALDGYQVRIIHKERRDQ